MLLLPFLTAALAAAAPVGLDDAYRASLRHSESFSSQEKQVLLAEERYSQAKGNLLPNLSASGSYMIQDRPTDPLAQSFFPRTQPEAKLTLRQPVFRGFREYAALRQFDDLGVAERHARDRAAQLLYNDVAQAFHGALAAESDLASLEEQLRLSDERIAELKGRVRAGTSSETDLIALQASRATVRSQLEGAVAAVTAAREAFSFVTGLPAASDLAAIDFNVIAHPRPGPVEEYLARIEGRPDLLSAQARVEAAHEGVGIARGGHLPTIDLQGNYYFKRPSAVYDGIDWDVQATLTLPLFSGGVTQSQVRESALARGQVELGLARLRRMAQQEVRTLHAAYLSGLDSIEALKESVELSDRNYQLLGREYRRGLTRNLDVLQALTASQEARRGLARAQYAARDGWVLLQTASGAKPPSDAPAAAPAAPEETQ